jgi:hypothetical protein
MRRTMPKSAFQLASHDGADFIFFGYDSALAFVTRLRRSDECTVNFPFGSSSDGACELADIMGDWP